MRRLFRRRPIEAAPETGESALRRELGAGSLVLLGVGAVVGAGIFSSVGDLAAGAAGRPGAGPALVLSFLLTAVACGFAALSYAELAALCPTAGSAYTYAYTTMGEIVGWIIGWDLVIEYAVGNIYVAQSWADYARTFVRGAFGLDFPVWMATDMQTANRVAEVAAVAPHLGGWAIGVNLPALLVVAALTVLLVRGVKESARVNAALVVFKILLVLTFVGVGAFFVRPANWHPFAPHGWRGIWSGASLAFFSYIGFDALSTVAEETRDPQKTLPRAMIGSLIICTVLYIATVVVMTGLVPSADLGVGDPLARTLQAVGLERLGTVMAFGAVVAVTAVLLVFQMGQPRILLAMARDGLLPPAFAGVHKRHRTPAFGTVMTGLFVGVSPSLLTPDQALELTSIGTLFAFLLVSLGVIVLRIREPERRRPFTCPGYPWVPLASIATCIVLMAGLPVMNWVRFGAWLALGMIIYAAYGRHHSRLA